MPLTTHDIGDYQTGQTLETFGFLPQLAQEEIYDQIAYVIAQGWTPAIEHVHPSQSMKHYWTMWKLPFFGETDLGSVVSELEACHRSYPDHHVRLIGYDNYTQSQGLAFVVFEGRG
ncbi:MAG: ribulose bisphosphate carboxylase small subunit [Chromatiales bacterium]|jgi:ribulose-bisphosphate carboxylase small chain